MSERRVSVTAADRAEAQADTAAIQLYHWPAVSPGDEQGATMHLAGKAEDDGTMVFDMGRDRVVVEVKTGDTAGAIGAAISRVVRGWAGR